MAKTVLIVDDDRLARAALRDAIAADGYRIVEAGDGEEALSMLASERPELMLLDLLMPRLSGLEVLARVREGRSPVPVLVISSMDSEKLISSALEAGALGFITKPFHPVEIHDAVSAALPG